MSADLNLVHIELARHANQDEGPVPSSLGHQLETIVAASRDLEMSLAREKNYSKQLRAYAESVIGRLSEVQRLAAERAEQVRDSRENEKKLSDRVSTLTAEFEKISLELKQYRNAWSGVLVRERQAKATLTEQTRLLGRIQELETLLNQTKRTYENSLAETKKVSDSAVTEAKRAYEAEAAARKTAESHAASHRQELQSVLVRLHTSEARFNEMTRELETVHQLRKNHQMELIRAEEMARDREENALLRGREMSRMDGERELRNAVVDADRRSALQVKQMQETHQAETVQRDMMIANLAENLKAQGAELAKSRRETAQLEEHATDRVLALQAELRLAYEVIMSERRKLQQLVERLLTGCDSKSILDRASIEALRNATETVVMVADTGERADPVVPGSVIPC